MQIDTVTSPELPGLRELGIAPQQLEETIRLIAQSRTGDAERLSFSSSRFLNASMSPVRNGRGLAPQVGGMRGYVRRAELFREHVGAA